MNYKQNIDFVQDVSEVLGIDCADLRSIYKDCHTEVCNDAISLSPLGEWRCDGLSLAPLVTRANNEIVSLLDWYKSERLPHKPKIILILESPHKDEYVKRCDECSRGCKCGLYASPAPARGATGRNIKQHLPSIFSNEFFKDYHVAHINPIQYQCSLGDSGNKYRKNKIFSTLISDACLGYGEDFMRRFRNVYDPDCDLVVCCCTDGIRRYPNSKKVLELLYEVLSNYSKIRFPLLKMPHPCRWDWSRKNRYVSILHGTSEGFVDVGKYYCFEKYEALCKYLLHDIRNDIH